MSHSHSLTIGAAISLMILLIAAVSFIWVPYDVTQLSIPDKLQRPNSTHCLGTDHFGRDLFSMIMVGCPSSWRGDHVPPGRPRPGGAATSRNCHVTHT